MNVFNTKMNSVKTERLTMPATLSFSSEQIYVYAVMADIFYAFENIYDCNQNGPKCLVGFAGEA